MNSTKVIWYNVVLLMFGIGGLLGLLNCLEVSKGSDNVYLDVVDFGKYYQESNLPDTLKSSKCFLAVFDAFKNANKEISFDTLIAKLNRQKEVNNKFADTTLHDDLKLLKLQADHFVVNHKYEHREKHNISYIEVIIAMGIAGFLGAILCNFRGFFEFFRVKKKFPKELIIPYMLRPYTGLICGIFSYFLATIITGSLTEYPRTSDVPFSSMMSFLGFAILAGFASQEFTERLKTAAGAMFGLVRDEGNNDQESNGQQDQNSTTDQSNDPPTPSLGSRGFINRD